MSQERKSVHAETLSKVAQVTIYFWLMKVLATTLGETAGDFISMTLLTWVIMRTSASRLPS